jgi:hypothetical protein
MRKQIILTGLLALTVVALLAMAHAGPAEIPVTGRWAWAEREVGTYTMWLPFITKGFYPKVGEWAIISPWWVDAGEQTGTLVINPDYTATIMEMPPDVVCKCDGPVNLGPGTYRLPWASWDPGGKWIYQLEPPPNCRTGGPGCLSPYGEGGGTCDAIYLLVWGSRDGTLFFGNCRWCISPQGGCDEGPDGRSVIAITGEDSTGAGRQE